MGLDVPQSVKLAILSAERKEAGRYLPTFRTVDQRQSRPGGGVIGAIGKGRGCKCLKTLPSASTSPAIPRVHRMDARMKILLIVGYIIALLVDVFVSIGIVHRHSVADFRLL